ncbi:hypothetical protein FM114_00650 [Luteococcus japonicus LSP_Lj1]|uniref:Uncharacterized protein n=1 Tax=Luteococcus japonicus LSP_Lj1 TaxID=1255658 RepID=A0A1R4IAV5_9ACTN|nr:hypothetical protein FM114_00650 [Luteococcus japonicus LSP_Lj1]
MRGHFRLGRWPPVGVMAHGLGSLVRFGLDESPAWTRGRIRLAGCV